MNIAMISLLLPSGSKIGVGYVVQYLANALVGRGHRVTIFSQTGPSPDSRYNVEIVPSGTRNRTFGFAWNLRRCDFSGFDVLNAHGDDWFLWGTRRPRHVHTFHGSCLAEMFSVTGIREKIRMGMLAICEYNSCLLAHKLVAVSENTRRYISAVRYVIPNGVDLTRFKPTEQKSTAPALLFVGTMHGRKRGSMLLDIFRNEIRRAIPNAEFWVVCETPVEGDGVRWFGRVSTDKLAELYRRAWVFCLPSTYEGFGVPYIEAMASGTPVVATPNPGAREVLCNGGCGLLCSAEALAETLISVLSNDLLRSELREKGLLRAQDFGWDRVCAQYEAIYSSSQERGRSSY